MRKRRFTSPLLKAHQERRAKQNATMAVRQSAGLSRAEAEPLKPLIKEADMHGGDGDGGSDIFFGGWASSNINWLGNAPSFQLQAQRPTLQWFYDAPVSTIDREKIESLKNTEPYVVHARMPDMVHVVTGWRGWKLKDGLLSALGVDGTWPVREALRAACRNGGNEQHLAPYWNCQCGIWAFKDTDRLLPALKGYGVDVVGSVSLWGRVIETENGYRAQYAYPSELWLLNPALEELGLLYGVPVRTVS